MCHHTRLQALAFTLLSYVCGCFVCVYVCTPYYVQSPQRLDEGVGPLRSRLKDDCGYMDAGMELGASQRASFTRNYCVFSPASAWLILKGCLPLCLAYIRIKSPGGSHFQIHCPHGRIKIKPHSYSSFMHTRDITGTPNVTSGLTTSAGIAIHAKHMISAF